MSLDEKKKVDERFLKSAWYIIGIFDDRLDEFPISKINSIIYFLRVLGLDTVEMAMRYAVVKVPNLTNYTFRYFCGICWGKIKEKQIEQISNENSCD